MKDIQIDVGQLMATPEPSRSVKQAVPSAEYEEKLQEMMTHIQDIEQKLTQKADEVVSYQLLKHRSELDDMSAMLRRLENRLIRMEAKQSNEEEELPMASGGTSRKGWKTLLQFFSF